MIRELIRPCERGSLLDVTSVPAFAFLVTMHREGKIRSVRLVRGPGSECGIVVCGGFDSCGLPSADLLELVGLGYFELAQARRGHDGRVTELYSPTAKLYASDGVLDAYARLSSL